MKIVFLILVFLHGLIHLLGFVKGYELKAVKELSLPISKTMGTVWLIAAILLLTYGLFHALNAKYVWLIGFIAVLVSQILIIAFWKDARFGTLPNIIILLVSFISWGHFSFQNRIDHEKLQLLHDNKILRSQSLQEQDLANLPAPVQKWIRNSGILNRPYIHSGKVTQEAEMRMKPEDQKWLPATAIQYTTVDVPGFVWSVDVKMNSFLGFQGRDKFTGGKGEMLIKVHSLLPVVDARGEKIDEGSLQRYLGEMVWFPSLAVSPFVSWEKIDDLTAKATMTYKGTSGSGTFYFNEKGDVIKFSALRFKDNDAAAKRREWIMQILEYRTFDGVRVPAYMTATWRLETGDWTWLKLRVIDIRYN